VVVIANGLFDSSLDRASAFLSKALTPVVPQLKKAIRTIVASKCAWLILPIVNHRTLDRQKNFIGIYAVLIEMLLDFLRASDGTGVAGCRRNR